MRPALPATLMSRRSSRYNSLESQIAAGIERGEASPIHYFDLGTDDDEVRPP